MPIDEKAIRSVLDSDMDWASFTIRQVIEAYEAAKEQPDERTGRLRHLLSAIRIGCTERYQPLLYYREGTPEYAALGPLCITVTEHLRQLLKYAEEAEQIVTTSPERESSSCTMEMCDKARGFIMGLDLGYRTFEEMRIHMSLGGYPTIPYIQNTAGHITKRDLAYCIYGLMTNTDIEDDSNR